VTLSYPLGLPDGRQSKTVLNSLASALANKFRRYEADTEKLLGESSKKFGSRERSQLHQPVVLAVLSPAGLTEGGTVDLLGKGDALKNAFKDSKTCRGLHFGDAAERRHTSTARLRRPQAR
jgi:hypothetical protein